MKIKNLRFCLTIILLTASLIPIVKAPNIQPEPIDSNDDAFITGAGNYFGDTPYLFLRDQVTSLKVGTRFRNVNIAQGQKINNATLFVRSVYTYAAGGDIRVQIRGDDIDDSLAFNDSGSFTRTYTSAYVFWNISEVNGDSWHNVSVTEIVQEIIDRVGWQSGNDLSLVFFTDKGTPRREFASVDGNPAYTAYIDINYGVPPPPDEVADIQDDASAPYNDTQEWEWEYNETYRGIDIYIVSEIGEYLNFSTFTLMGADSGKITGLNDTYFLVTNVYTHSDVYLRRNFTDFRDNSSETIAVKFGIKWIALPWQGPATYQWYGIWGISEDHGTINEDWIEGYAYSGRTWSDKARTTSWSVTGGGVSNAQTWGPFIYESGLPVTLYYHIRLDMARMIHNVSVYNDPEMEDLNVTINALYASGPGDISDSLVYEYIISRWTTDPSNTGFTAEFLSNFGSEDLDEFIFIVYPNGTLVDPDPVDPDEDPYNVIDDLLGGAQPEDPESDEYTIVDKFRWKLLVLCVGMIMMIGSPLAGVIYGADTATWIKLLFVAFFGLGILWQIKFM